MSPLCHHNNFYAGTEQKQTDSYTICHATDTQICSCNEGDDSFYHFTVTDACYLHDVRAWIAQRVPQSPATWGGIPRAWEAQFPYKIGPLNAWQHLPSFRFLQRCLSGNLHKWEIPAFSTYRHTSQGISRACLCKKVWGWEDCWALGSGDVGHCGMLLAPLLNWHLRLVPHLPHPAYAAAITPLQKLDFSQDS